VSAFWAVYNLAMMGVVIEMALRPVQKRETCRFKAVFPVSVTPPTIADRREVGMTANVSATGCELLWRRPLPAGSIWPLSIALGGHVLECQGEDTPTFRRRRGVWFAHGIQFVNLSQEQTDFLNDAIFNMVVPRLFDHLSQPSIFTHVRRQIAKWLRTAYSVRSRRSLVSVPVQLDSSRGSVVTMLHDISASGFGVVVPRQIPVGSRVTITVLGGDPWSVDVTVARAQAMPASLLAFRTWLLGLQIDRAIDVSAIHRRVSQEAAA